MKYYYLDETKTRKGPHSIGELSTLLETGVINDSTLAAVVGGAESEKNSELLEGHEGSLLHPVPNNNIDVPFPPPLDNISNIAAQTTTKSRKNRFVAAFLAFTWGGAQGAHKFYHGSTGWGIIYLLSSTLGFASIAFCVKSQGWEFLSDVDDNYPKIFLLHVLLLMAVSPPLLAMVEDLIYLFPGKWYNRRYNQQPERPFKW